jgi:hypothetical protein
MGRTGDDLTTLDPLTRLEKIRLHWGPFEFHEVE